MTRATLRCQGSDFSEKSDTHLSLSSKPVFISAR